MSSLRERGITSPDRDRNFDLESYKKTVHTEELVCRLIQEQNKGLSAIWNRIDNGKADITVYDENSYKIAYIEVESLKDELVKDGRYKYPSLTFWERRINKKYDLPVIYIHYCPLTKEYLMITRKKALEEKLPLPPSVRKSTGQPEQNYKVMISHYLINRGIDHIKEVLSGEL